MSNNGAMGYSRALQKVKDQGDKTEPAKKTEKEQTQR